MTEHHISHTRADYLDQLRGLAVVGMIIAHGLYFFHNGANIALVGLARILNTIVLTLFVFTAGLAASRSLDSTNHLSIRHLLWQCAKRVGTVYAAYIVIICTQIGLQAITLSLQQMRDKLVAAVTLLAPPSFTEFLPLFILITIISIPFRNLYRLSRSSLAITLGVSAVLYVLGIALYTLDVPNYLVGIKALTAGHESYLRFPLFFYLPVYLLGLWWQHVSDHKNARDIGRQKTGIIAAISIIVLLGIGVSKSLHISILDPLTRWPPSIGFLATGLLFSICAYLLQPILNALPKFKKIIGYMGHDALDMLIHHLVLLFLYRAVIGTQFGTIPQVFVAVIILFTITTILSSLAFTNNITFPVHIQTHAPVRLRKRYILLIILMFVFVTWNMLLPKNVSPYGNTFKKNSTVTNTVLPKTATIYISTNRTWYAHQFPKTAQIELSAQVIDATNGKSINVSPDSMSIYSADQIVPISGYAQNNNVVTYIISTKQIPAGTHTLSVRIKQQGSTLKSNNIVIHVTEPLMVAWTFDWEGWAPSQESLSKIEMFSKTYTPIVFTHFVHPRMFISNISTATQKNEIQSFLKNRQLYGDEIALHMHMQFDFVAAAGITPKRSNPWGLRTNEGYDIPTTEYSPREFRAMIDFGLSKLAEAGFSNIRGFRAGGWFINEQQLEMVKNAGFLYDSSGRSKPHSGAFQNTPWDLPADIQPYRLDLSDQNITTSQDGLLEIPNNALTTYDQSVIDLITFAKTTYTGNPLLAPKTLIYVSHPQFYNREFEKIPPVLDYLQSVSLENDKGPVIFSTMSDIANLWISPKF